MRDCTETQMTNPVGPDGPYQSGREHNLDLDEEQGGDVVAKAWRPSKKIDSNGSAIPVALDQSSKQGGASIGADFVLNGAPPNSESGSSCEVCLCNIITVVLGVLIIFYATLFISLPTIADGVANFGVNHDLNVIEMEEFATHIADDMLACGVEAQAAVNVFCSILILFAVLTLCRVTCLRKKVLEEIKKTTEMRRGSTWGVIRAFQRFQDIKGVHSPTCKSSLHMSTSKHTIDPVNCPVFVIYFSRIVFAWWYFHPPAPALHPHHRET